MKFVVLGIVAFFCNIAALAADYRAGSIEILTPWSRATPKGAATAVGYMTFRNIGATSDRLVGASVDVANSVQLHSMVIENGVAKMRERHNIELKPGQTIEFKPGGSHAMFVKLKHALSKGDRVSGTLVFERAGTVQIQYEVAGLGDQTAPHEMDHMQK